MSFNIVWAPVDTTSPLGRALGASADLSLPHLVDDPHRHRPEGGLHTALNAKTLSLGILMTTDEGSPFVALLPTHQQLRVALRLVAQDLRVASEDELCASGAAYLREQHGSDTGLTALRRAVELLPDSVLCRGDLVAGLFMRATGAGQKAPADLEEVAAVFLAWQRESTSQCANAEVVFYCGLAALTYLARLAERDQLLMSHRPLITRSSWLRDQLPRLHNARPGHLADIAITMQ
jgi:hypothetical protein